MFCASSSQGRRIAALGIAVSVIHALAGCRTASAVPATQSYMVKTQSNVESSDSPLQDEANWGTGTGLLDGTHLT